MALPLTITFSKTPSKKYREVAGGALLRLQDLIAGAEGKPENPFYFAHAGFDERRMREMEEVLKEKSIEKVKFVILIGIGGSNLGTQAVYDGMRGKLALLKTDVPRLIGVDTLSAPLLRELSHVVEHEIGSLEELLVISISKSGNTLETIANTETVMAMVENRFGNPASRIVVVTDGGNAFESQARMRGMTTVALEKGIGGRFSVFSVVGLLPLMAFGFDGREFLKGAREVMQELFTDKHAARYLAFLLQQYAKKTRIHDFFVFNPELESLGKWHRQLMAESTARVVDGKPTGILPTVSVGSTDLHSQAQLYCSGSAGLKRMTTFVWAKQLPTQIRIPSQPLFHTVDHIAGKSFKHLMNAVLKGIMGEYDRQKAPYASVQLADISAASLGGFMMAQLLLICAFCDGIGVSSFGQDAVEGYKRETRAYLQQESEKPQK